MTGKVIQGLFIGGRPRVPTPVAQSKATPRPPGPPAPAFAGRPPVAQPHGAGGAFQVDPGQLGLVSTGGRPLPDAVRGKMEAALGADFSGVRVHVGPQAERIGAIALTMGTDIYFAPGRYQPETVHGQQLLGHELAHVVQQRQGRVRNPLGAGVAVVQDHALEAEADRLGHRAAEGGLLLAIPTSTTTLVPPATKASVTQLKGNKCVVCSHRHSARCRTLLQDGNECGCISHSSKWDSGSKVNPGQGRRDRMIARNTNQ